MQKHVNGTFVAVRFNEETKRILYDFALTNGIPNMYKSDEYHSTVVYSRVPIHIVESQRDIDPNWIGTPIGFDLFEGVFNGKTQNCCVLKFHCEELNVRHQFLRTFGQATHHFPEYNSHITLSNDIGDFDISDLSDISIVLPKIVIVSEFSEELKDEDRRVISRKEEKESQ